MTQPTLEQIEALKQWDAPTLANAIETFGVCPQTEGFCDTGVKCLFPDLGRMVGFAVTAQSRGCDPADDSCKGVRERHWREVLKVPGPRVVVVEDLDPPPRQGALFGEVTGNLHKALGCVGLVTNGSVRDLDEVRALGFHYFARSACVTHTYCHYVATGQPVTVGGLEVEPGDLIYGDKHGVLRIPLELVAEIPRACRELLAKEKVIIDFCQGADFDPARIEEIIAASAQVKY
jgi:regulator of RNase E activity RraA